jgi:transcriptional regulator with XRE-family HTH domain
MEIGNNIRQARIVAGLTQEQAAELLLVSRQTISNWENDKTLPDAMQIHSICFQYGVNAEWLINNKTVDTQESQPEKPSREPFSFGGKTAGVLALAYLGCWFLCVLFFYMGGSGAFALFYALVILKILFPTLTFVASILLGFLNCYPLFRIFYIFGFGVMHSLLPYFTYDLANTLSTGRIHSLNWDTFAFGLCLSAVGIVFGWLIRVLSLLVSKWVNWLHNNHTA